MVIIMDMVLEPAAKLARAAASAMSKRLVMRGVGLPSPGGLWRKWRAAPTRTCYFASADTSATSSAVRVQAPAAALVLTCSGLVAPAITELTAR